MIQWGEFTQMWDKDSPADHVSLTLLAQVCNGIKRHRRVHVPFIQIVVTITLYIDEKLLRNSPLKYVGPGNRLLALQKCVGTLRNVQ
jgi:hypothetical protein